MTISKQPRRRSRRKSRFKSELDDLVRGLCGGFLFGIPMLYTMEVWWIGSASAPSRLIVVLISTLICTYLLSRTAGFRKAQAAREREAVGDAVEAIALGLICATFMLIVIQQVTFNTRLSEALGKIVLESVPFSLGVALSNQLLQESDDKENQEGAKKKGFKPGSASASPQSAGSNSLSKRFMPKGNLNETLADIGATLIGSAVIAFSIAPTDEVAVLVTAMHGPWLVLMVLISVVLSYGIVFQANFTRQGQRLLQKGLFQQPISETIFSYLISLLAAALMLGFFRQIDPGAPWDLTFRQIVVLGLPATIGGAAGRLAL